MSKDHTSFLQSRLVLFLRAAIALVFAYILGSLAIDSGRWLQYLLCVVCLLLGIKFIIQFARYGKE